MATHDIANLADFETYLATGSAINFDPGDVINLTTDIVLDDNLTVTPWLGRALQEVTLMGNNHTIDTQGAQLFPNAIDSTISDLKIVNPAKPAFGYAFVQAQNSKFTNIRVKNLGVVDEPSACELVNCVGEGKLDVTSTTSETIGSLVGTAKGGSKLYKCTSYTDLTVNISTSASYTADNTGGIVGSAIDHSWIVSCKNCGNITMTLHDATSSSAVGGIVGGQYDDAVEDCVNTGRIIVSSLVPAAKAEVGGIIGHAYGPLVKNNINVGDVKADNANVGGIAGVAGVASIIEDNTNTGSVSAQGFTGGIVGFSQSNKIQYNVVCAKEIKGGDGVGGIMGRGELGNKANVSNNAVNATISGNGCLNYIIGVITSVGTSVVVEDNYYNGMSSLVNSGICGSANVITDEQSSGAEYNPEIENQQPAIGDRLNACMRNIWSRNQTESCTKSTMGMAQGALTSIIGSVASIENGLNEIITANACILRRGLQQAESQEDLDIINQNLQGLLELATTVEDKLQGKLKTSTEEMKTLHEKCGCVGLNGLCCVPLYLAADGSRVPAQGVALEVVEVGTNKVIDPLRTITDGEGKVLLELEPNTTYVVTMHSDGEWRDEKFSITVDVDCQATVDGAESVCCADGCAVTVCRPEFCEFTRRSCGTFIPFAPSCAPTNVCGFCQLDF